MYLFHTCFCLLLLCFGVRASSSIHFCHTQFFDLFFPF